MNSQNLSEDERKHVQTTDLKRIEKFKENKKKHLMHSKSDELKDKVEKFKLLQQDFKKSTESNEKSIIQKTEAFNKSPKTQVLPDMPSPEHIKYLNI